MSINEKMRTIINKKTAWLCVCLCFFMGCRSFSEPTSTRPEQKSMPYVVIPSAAELESVTLILGNDHASQFGLEYDPTQFQYVKLNITDPQKIENLTRIFQEMKPEVVPWPRGYLSCPAPSRLILKRKETTLSGPNAIGEFDLTGRDSFSGAFVRLVTDMEFEGMTRLGGGYLVNVSPEGLAKLNAFLNEEFQKNQNNPDICIFEPWPTKMD